MDTYYNCVHYLLSIKLTSCLCSRLNRKMDFDFAGRKVVEKEDGGASEYDPAMVRIQNSNRRDRRDLLHSMNQIQSGAATSSEGFVTCFLRVLRLLGCTAQASKENFQKT